MTLEQKGKKLGIKKLYLHNRINVESLATVLYYLFSNVGTLTYSDPESNIRQVDTIEGWDGPYQRVHGFSRSFDDAFIIAHTYFPNIEYRLVQKSVRSLYPLSLSSWICETVHKKVHGICRKPLETIKKHLDDLELNYYEK